MEDESDGAPPQRPASLLPYDAWTEEAFRHVVIRALAYAGANGLPGDHHFYVSFRTDHPEASVPQRLRSQYPEEMTIVLQHQFWDLQVDEPGGWFSIGLSFGGIPTTLTVPFTAITAFADPHVQFALRFTPPVEPEATPQPEPERQEPPSPPSDTPQVVSLDAFRKRTPTKD